MKNLLLFLLLHLTWAASGQEFPAPRNTLGLRVGLQRLTMLDRNASSLIYRGNLPLIGLELTANRPHGYWLGRVEAGRGSFFSKTYPDRTAVFLQQDIHGKTDTIAVPMRGTSTFGRLELGYLRKLNPGGSIELATGALLSDAAYYQEGFVTPGLLNAASLSPAAQLAWQGASDLRLVVSVAVPILALVSRSAYHNSVSQPKGDKIGGFFSQGTRLESIDQHREVRVAASLQYPLSRHWSAGLSYEFHFLKNDLPRPMNLVSQGWNLCLDFTY